MNKWRICFALCFAFTWSPVLHSQEDEKITDPVDTKLFKVFLLGDDGKPVQGATVKPYAMRCSEEKGSHYGWPTGNVGPAPTLVSNQEGIVEIPYPVRFGRDPDWLTTCQISFMVNHHEYVSAESHSDIDTDENETEAIITLVPGCEVSLSAVDAKLKPVSFGVNLPYNAISSKWVREDGFFRSRSIPPGIFPAMLVAPGENGETLFSDVVALELSEKQSARIRNVPLKKGIKFFGKLPDTVPRPIVDGHVAIEICPEFDSEGKDPEKLYWSDWTKIEEDGSFVFPSIPRSGTMRIFVHCKGWMQEEKGKEFIVKGIDIDLTDSVSKDGDLEYDPPMEETGDLEITVINAEGDPVAGAKVATWPNMQVLSGGSTILASAGKSLSFIEFQLKDKMDELNFDDERSSRTPTRFSGETNEDGVVVLKDIPLHRNESIYIQHSQYALPNAGKDGRVDRTLKYQIDEPGVKKLIVEVVELKDNK